MTAADPSHNLPDRAALLQYERGAVRAPDPAILRALGRIYSTPNLSTHGGDMARTSAAVFEQVRDRRRTAKAELQRVGGLTPGLAMALEQLSTGLRHEQARVDAEARAAAVVVRRRGLAITLVADLMGGACPRRIAKEAAHLAKHLRRGRRK